MMVLRTAILGAMVLCTASLAMADETLYCADTTAGIGFLWDDTGKGHTTRFNPRRYTVKVISDTERAIAEMTGDVTGEAITYTCHSRHDQIACDDEPLVGNPWMFYKNNYTHAFLAGTPVGPPKSMDPNISIAYGTCTRF